MPISTWVKNLRDMIGTDLVVMIGAAAIVTDEQGRILLQQRADNERWGVPGGAIEPGEEPAQAAVREVHEETGLEVEVIRLVGVFGGKEQIKSYANGDRFAYVSVTFECRVIGGEIKPDPDESKDVRWFTMDDLPSQFVSVHRRRLTAWQTQNIPFFEIPSHEFLNSASSNYIHQMRSRVGNTLLMSPGATGIIFDENGAVLVQKRGDDGLWNIPSGLYELGEEPAETAIREIYEETGLIVQPTRLVGVYAGKDYCHTYPNGDQVAFVNFVFVCEIVSGELNTNNHETEALCFVSPHALPEPFTKKHRILIEHALTRSEPYFAF